MLALILSAMLEMKSETWYGPAEVSFELSHTGSSYDAEENDVQVEFASGNHKERRIAFFDGAKWRAILLTPKAGTYSATLFRNGAKLRTLGDRLSFQRKGSPAFVRIEKSANRFTTANGKPYWPIGHNLGWQSQNHMAMSEQLALMGKAGLNWSRIWACSWDGKNPYWVDKKTLASPRDMFPEAMNRWDEIVAAASKSGIQFQFVLFHHGQFSSNVNPNWPDHPWNRAKGGFLEKPDDFFTHPEAIRRAKNWLRYAVARWGHDPSVMAWELFNEVEWCDGMRNNPTAVAKWHEDMAAYIRSIDPYRHLVTTSSWMELPIWKAMDFYQPHGYPPSVRAMVMGMAPTADKPLFYGEVGLGEGSGVQSERLVVRESIWSGLMAGQAGAAQFWYWDGLKPEDYVEFKRFTDFDKKHRLTNGAFFKPIPTTIRSRQSGAVQFSPGQGWAKTTQFVFSMPADAVSGALGKLSGFIQGPGKRDMMSEPIRFEFESATPGRFEMTVSSVARAGANIHLSLDGIAKVDEKVAASDRDQRLNKTFGFEFPAGKHTVTVTNPGPDWYVAGSFKIDAIGQAVTGACSVSGDRALLWLARNADGDQPESFELTGLPSGWGAAKVVKLDLDTGATEEAAVQLSGGKLSGSSMGTKNAIWLLTRSD